MQKVLYRGRDEKKIYLDKLQMIYIEKKISMITQINKIECYMRDSFEYREKNMNKAKTPWEYNKGKEITMTPKMDKEHYYYHRKQIKENGCKVEWPAGTRKYIK